VRPKDIKTSKKELELLVKDGRAICTRYDLPIEFEMMLKKKCYIYYGRGKGFCKYVKIKKEYKR